MKILQKADVPASYCISGCDQGHCVTACPHGWEEYGDSCFYLSPKGRVRPKQRQRPIRPTYTKTWDAAEADCKARDSHLASIPSPTIQEYVLNGMKRKGIDRLWLGGKDKDGEGNWEWADCSFFGFTSWASGEPNNAGGIEHCMEMGKNFGEEEGEGGGMWNDLDCATSQQYLCTTKKCSGGVQSKANVRSPKLQQNSLQFFMDP